MAKKFTQNESNGPKGWTVWQVTGRIDNQNADEVHQYGEAVVKKSDKTVLDMSQMEYLSSAGLRVLLRLNRLAQKTGKRFTVSGADGMVDSVLQDSGMGELLQMKKSLADLEE